MKRSMIICRTVSASADGWYQLYPRGEIEATATIAGKQEDVLLVLDDTTFAAITAAFREDVKKPNWEGYLVGKEHFSLQETGSSEAYAWCKELATRPDGLWGRFEKTALGESSIGTIYKYRSPVSDLEQISGRQYRPVNIVDIGLTNKPMFKTLAAAVAREGQQQEESTMDKVRLVLGLKSDATEDQVVARVQSALAAEKTLETTRTELTTAQGQLAARDADAFVAEHDDLIPETDRETVKGQFIAARETVKTIYAGLRKQHPRKDKPAQRVLAREAAATPASQTAAGESDPSGTHRAARVSARAQELRKNDPRLGLAAAYNRAESEINSAQ